MKKYLAPSLLSADFYNLESEIKVLKENNIKYLHLDVMDGHFVPNISFGIPVIKKIKENVKDDFILDTHLMIENPSKYVKAFKEAGANILTIHIEATEKYKEILDMIKNEGMLAGISINPETEIKSIDSILGMVDLVLVMSVHPGFDGQKFIESSLDKVAYLKDKKEKNGYNYIIELDGGVNDDNAKMILDSGVELLVAGTAVFKGDIKSNIQKINKLL